MNKHPPLVQQHVLLLLVFAGSDYLQPPQHCQISLADASPLHLAPDLPHQYHLGTLGLGRGHQAPLAQDYLLRLHLNLVHQPGLLRTGKLGRLDSGLGHAGNRHRAVSWQPRALPPLGLHDQVGSNLLQALEAGEGSAFAATNLLRARCRQRGHLVVPCANVDDLLDRCRPHAVHTRPGAFVHDLVRILTDGPVDDVRLGTALDADHVPHGLALDEARGGRAALATHGNVGGLLDRQRRPVQELLQRRRVERDGVGRRGDGGLRGGAGAVAQLGESRPGREADLARGEQGLEVRRVLRLDEDDGGSAGRGAGQRLPRLDGDVLGSLVHLRSDRDVGDGLRRRREQQADGVRNGGLVLNFDSLLRSVIQSDHFMMKTLTETKSYKTTNSNRRLFELLLNQLLKRLDSVN